MKADKTLTGFIGWSVGLLLVGAVFTVQMRRGPQLETNILSLLPTSERDPVVAHAVEKFTRTVTAKMVFAVAHPEETRARDAARMLTERLEGSELFEDITGRLDSETDRSFFDLYFPYRYQLLSRATRAQLQADPQAGQKLVRRAEEALYSPMSSLVTANLEKDPLLLFPDFLQGFPKPGGSLAPREGWLTATRQNIHYILVTASTAVDAFSVEGQAGVTRFLSGAEEDLKDAVAGVRLHSMGVIRYAAAAAETAEGEVSTIGVGSFAGVVLLFLLVFRSPRPLLLGLIPILTGLLAAVTVCFAVFPKVHLITLGFGASLIGICIDYTFHFFCEQWTEKIPPAKALRAIFAAISLGALTSVLGYLGLLVAPFPGLRQMALFSSVGLIGAFLTVVFCFPFLARATPGNLEKPCRAAAGFLALVQRLFGSGLGRFLAVAIAVSIGAGLWRLQTDDDIRLLRSSPPSLLAEESLIRDLAGNPDTSRFLLVEGEDPESVLQREERLTGSLEALKVKGDLAFYQSLATVLPSAATQKENARLLKSAFSGSDSPLERYMRRMEFEEPALVAAITAVGSEPDNFLTMGSWLDHPVSQSWRHLWLGETERGYASLILLGGIADPARLRTLASQSPNLHYIDKVADYSDLLRRYRGHATWLVGLSYLVVFGFLMWRYGFIGGIRVTLPALVAALLVLALMGLTGRPANLFHLLALLLVLGIGIDYTIFYAEAGNRRTATTLAVLCSACTTLLSFGLLSLSQTPVLRSFGTTVLVGITAVALLSPLAAANLGPKKEPVHE